MNRRAAFPGLLVFASGASMPADIAGFGNVGFHVGVVADKLSDTAERALLALPPHVHVFLDSGAYSEVKFTPAGPVTVAPISPDDWVKRLALYARLAAALGPRLHVVAPDKVGSQSDTLSRLRAYAPEIRALARTGAEILLPLQPGPMSFLDFEREAGRALGVPFTPAIPMRQKATTLDTLTAWARARQPARVHLLGLGEHSADAEDVIAALQAASPKTAISLDANRLASAAGRTGGKGGGARPLTAWGDYGEMEANAARWGDDYEEMVGTPSAWLTKAELRAVAKDAMLDDAVARRWLKDPDTFPDEEDRAYLDEALDRAWAAYRRKQEGGTRRVLAIERTFGPELRRVDARTLFHALYTAAVTRMMRKNSTVREIELVEYLDARWFAERARAAIQRALKTEERAGVVFPDHRGPSSRLAPRPLVLACSDTKRQGRLPAIDKYDGPLWRSLRAHRGAFSRPIYVLSAKYGLVSADTPIDDYNAKIGRDVSPAKLAPLVARQARALGITSVDVAAGEDYRNTLRLAGIDAHPLPMDVPKGRGRGGIGDQRAALRAYLQTE